MFKCTNFSDVRSGAHMGGTTELGAGLRSGSAGGTCAEAAGAVVAAVAALCKSEDP